MARRKTLSPEFKKVISQLSPKEKDKLLFRLLPKEPALVAKLEYDLLEGGDNVEVRRNELSEQMEMRLREATADFYSPGYLLLDLRSLSGDITRHVKVTKDKYGEIQMNFMLLNEGIGPVVDKINGFSKGRARTLNDYVVKRVLKLFALLHKQHPDIRLDFADEMKELGGYIGRIDSMMHTAIFNGMDVNYLLSGEVPPA